MTKLSYCLFVLQFIITSCQPPSNMTKSDPTIDTKLNTYLHKKYDDNFKLLSNRINKNEGNLNDEEFSYSASFNADKLDYHIASIQYFNRNTIEPTYDTYVQEYACLLVDKHIEESFPDYNMVVWNKMMKTINPDEEILSLINDPDELKKKVFHESAFQTRIIIVAPDIKSNRSKYELFHIELMKQLKSQHIVKSDLDIYFIDDIENLEEFRSSPESVIGKNHKLNNYILQRWISIHNNKWYDMVKDHPDKVLNYGRIIEF